MSWLSPGLNCVDWLLDSSATDHMNECKTVLKFTFPHLHTNKCLQQYVPLFTQKLRVCIIKKINGISTGTKIIYNVEIQPDVNKPILYHGFN